MDTTCLIHVNLMPAYHVLIIPPFNASNFNIHPWFGIHIYLSTYHNSLHITPISVQLQAEDGLIFGENLVPICWISHQWYVEEAQYHFDCTVRAYWTPYYPCEHNSTILYPGIWGQVPFVLGSICRECASAVSRIGSTRSYNYSQPLPF